MVFPPGKKSSNPDGGISVRAFEPGRRISMKRHPLRSATFAALAALVLAAPLAAQTPWIHVEVDERGREESRVRVNLPLSLVEVALEAAPEKIAKHSHIHLDHAHGDVDIEDLRRIWRELRRTGDAELFSVEEKNQKVSVRREGDRVLVDVDEHGSGETVRIQVPVSVVDALFSAEGEELNVKDAVAELKKLRGDIVSVDDGESKVRVWIDERD
jgi:hypothetical protein